MSNDYWHGLVHGLLLTLPLLTLFYRKWQQCAKALTAAGADTSVGANAGAVADARPPTLGTFLNDLFTYEVVLVAGAEMKAVKDQLQTAEQEGNARRVDALKGRLLDIARVLDQKLQLMLPIVRFLTEQSVNCIREQSIQDSQDGDNNSSVDTVTTTDEPKKDK